MFLNKTQIPLCGSTILFLTKPLCHGDCQITAKALSDLSYQRITVNIIQSRVMGYGGFGPVFDASDATRGLTVLAGEYPEEDDSSFDLIADKIMRIAYPRNLLYSQSFPFSNDVSAQQLDSLTVPSDSNQSIDLNLVITTDMSAAFYFQSIKLTFCDRITKSNTTLAYNRDDYFSNSDSIWKEFQLSSGQTYDVFMDFSRSIGNDLEIRIYTDKLVAEH